MNRPTPAGFGRTLAFVVALAMLTAVSLLAVGAAAQINLLGSAAPPASFHHLHLMAGGRDASLVGFYERLFPPAAITRGSFWDADGIRGDGVFLLWSRPSAPREYGKPTAIWHFGWGKVSLGETYAAHLLKEVNWKPPYPSLTSELHVHLRSRDPIAAAAWYESVLGARRETLPRDPAVSASQSTTPTPAGTAATATAAVAAAAGASHIEGEAEALVRFGPFALVIHWTEQALEPTRSVGPIDHLSFQVADLPTLSTHARARNVLILDHEYPLADVPTLTLEGPDHITIELLQRPKGPDFWHERP